jgi:hypothetical protein
VIRHTYDEICSSFFSMRTCVTIVPNMINYIYSSHLRLYNRKRLSLLMLQQETRPYINGFALGCCDQSTTVCNCDHNSLKERDPNNERACEIHWKTTEKYKVGSACEMCYQLYQQ